MPKNSEASFSGSFVFSNPDINMLASAQLRASLYIGHVNNPHE